MIKKSLITILLIIVALVGLTYASGYGFLITAAQRVYLQGNTTANINDYQQFYTRTIQAGIKQALNESSRVNSKPLSEQFQQDVADQGIAAFLVIQNGEIVSERYFNGYNDRSKTNSFSMAKTVLTMMVAKAIDEGHIESFDQPLIELLPEFSDDPLAKEATLAQLSLMTSGYEWTEHYYSPISPTVELLYGSDIEDFLLDGEFSAEPGTFWEYSSASTQLLGIALLRALRKSDPDMTLSQYLSDTLWKPLAMNDDGLWHLDNSGMELVFCCLNTNARNYARFGMLMLNDGVWYGKRLLPAGLVEQMIQPIGDAHYGYSTWLGLEHDPAHYYLSGHLGQFVIVVPEHNMVVVRLGESTSSERDMIKDEIPMLIQEALGQLPN